MKRLEYMLPDVEFILRYVSFKSTNAEFMFIVVLVCGNKTWGVEFSPGTLVPEPTHEVWQPHCRHEEVRLRHIQEVPDDRASQVGPDSL